MIGNENLQLLWIKKQKKKIYLMLKIKKSFYQLETQKIIKFYSKNNMKNKGS